MYIKIKVASQFKIKNTSIPLINMYLYSFLMFSGLGDLEFESVHLKESNLQCSVNNVLVDWIS